MKMLKPLFLAVLLFSTVSLSAQKQPFEVEVTGSGDPILLFPGFACTGEVFDNLVAELSKNHQCHVFTFAGFGGVEPVEKPWLPKLKAGVEEYVKSNNIEKPTLIGHSMGGTLALWLASEDNNAYSDLIIVDALPAMGALMMPGVKPEDITYDNPYNTRMLNMNADDFKASVSQTASSMTLSEEKVPQILDWILQADRETYVYGYTDLLKLDLREDLSKIKIPVTLLIAAKPYGKAVVESTMSQQYANLEGYEMAIAENSAHFIMYDQPDWFIKQVEAHLNQ